MIYKTKHFIKKSNVFGETVRLECLLRPPAELEGEIIFGLFFNMYINQKLSSS